MHNKLAFLIGLLFLVQPAWAQQEQMYTQFMLYKPAYNPAANGNFESPALLVAYRSQWINKIEGAPNTQFISFTMPMLSNRVGLGGNLVRSTIGITRTLTLEGAYAYRIPFKRGAFCIGIQPSVRQFYQNWGDSRLAATQPIPTDQAIPTTAQSKIVPNLGFGLFYSGKKRGRERWYAGVAATRLVRNNIDFADGGLVLSQEVQHFNAMAGYNFQVDENIVCTPQVLLKYAPNVPFDADINFTMVLKEKYFSALTYRTGGDTNKAGESVDVLVGLQANKFFFFCLSYDIGLTRLRRFNNGSIELSARYYFNPPEGSNDKISKPNL